MSGSDVIAYLLWVMAGAAVIVALAMIPALLLVTAYRFGGSRTLWGLAVLFSVGLSASLLPTILDEAGWSVALFWAFSTVVAPLATAAAIVVGIGGASAWRQTLGAGSTALLVACLPFAIAAVLIAQWAEKLMAAAALGLMSYLALRHYQSFRHSRRAVWDSSPPAV